MPATANHNDTHAKELQRFGRRKVLRSELRLAAVSSIRSSNQETRVSQLVSRDGIQNMPLVITAHPQVISVDEEWGDGTLSGRRLRFVARL